MTNIEGFDLYHDDDDEFENEEDEAKIEEELSNLQSENIEQLKGVEVSDQKIPGQAEDTDSEDFEDDDPEFDIQND